MKDPSPASTPVPTDQSSESPLDSWKEIATYVKRDVSTVQRWEKREAMPIHRHVHDKRGSVYAFGSELDTWLQSRKLLLEQEEKEQTADTLVHAEVDREPWRIPWVGRWLTAAIAAVLIVLGFATWRVFARPVLTESDVILLANFVNNTGDPIFENSLDKALEIKLTESPFLSLFPEASVHATMGMMRHDPNERVTQDLGIEICKRQGLKAVVVPEIAAFGSRYLITLDAVDVQNQKSIARRQEEAESKDKVIAALGKAASGLRKQLGENLKSLEKYNAPLDLATTSSLEALQAYREGMTQFRSGKTRESIAFFERAVELDPQFCSAYSMLGHAY